MGPIEPTTEELARAREIPIDMGKKCPGCGSTTYHLTNSNITCSECSTVYRWKDLGKFEESKSEAM